MIGTNKFGVSRHFELEITCLIEAEITCFPRKNEENKLTKMKLMVSIFRTQIYLI